MFLAVGKLISGTKIGWNSEKRELKFENTLTLKSTNPFSPIVNISAGMSSAVPGLPVFKISMKSQPINPLKGSLDGHYFITSDFGVEIELTPQEGGLVFEKVPVSAPSVVPSPSPTTVKIPPETVMPATPDQRQPTTGDHVLSKLLIAGAVVITVVIVVDDLTGIGTADDVPGFALVASMMAKASQLVRTTAAVAPPAAAAYAY